MSANEVWLIVAYKRLISHKREPSLSRFKAICKKAKIKVTCVHRKDDDPNIPYCAGLAATDRKTLTVKRSDHHMVEIDPKKKISDLWISSTKINRYYSHTNWS